MITTQRMHQVPSRGIAIIELAVAMPMLTLLLLGSLDFALQLHVRHRMSIVARESARILAVQDGTVQQATSLAQKELSDVKATFTITATDASASSPDVIVRVSVPRKDISLGFSSRGTMTAQVTMRKEGGV